MVERNVALVADTAKIDDAELKRVEQVLLTRVRRDLAPIWDVGAAIQSYRDSHKIGDAWPVIVRDDIGQPGAASYHSTNKGMPFALIAYNSDWPFMASHDLVEMLIDPNANRLISGPNPRRGQKKRVNYLVEVCDPCADRTNGYQIDGFQMADFCTPDFYLEKPGNPRYSFTGAISKPFEVLAGGYLTWIDPGTRHWWQKVYFGAKPEYRDLGVFDSDASDEAEPAVRRRRQTLTSISLQQMREARDTYGLYARSILEKLIADFGTPPK
jgi:hypothetical protein